MNQDNLDKPTIPDADELSSDAQGPYQTEAANQTDKHSYGQILKSSALIGGSSMINIVIGMVRTKSMAMILGPSGVGLMGLYSSIMDLTQSVVGMGVNSSGVRQIAEAVGSDELERVARTAQVLQRTSLFLGLLGAAFLFGFSPQLSELTFGNSQHANGVALLSLAVLFNILSAGQGALLQGMRRISDLAKMGVFGAIFGTLISIPTVYFLHEDGVAISIVLVSAMGLLTSWWYRRKVVIPSVPIMSGEMGQEQAALLRLGFAFMSSGLMMSGAAYVVRLFVVRYVGFEAAGLYQSAWALGGLYIGFILNSMGTDFYPRLTAISHDNIESNRMVNEQAHVSLLLAGPGVIATLTFAPLAIMLFYTSKFEGAVELLRWLCLGMTMRVISWPMGFIIVAKNAQKLFFFSEFVWTAVYLGLAWVGVGAFGLNGVGIAFFGSYIFHVAMIYIIVRQLTGFRWSAANIKTCCCYLVLVALVFSSYYIVPSLLTIGIGLLGTALSAAYSIRVLVTFISPDRIPKRISRVLALFRLTGSGASLPQPTRSRLKPRPFSLKWLMLVLIMFGIGYIGLRWNQNPTVWLDALDFVSGEFKAIVANLKRP